MRMSADLFGFKHVLPVFSGRRGFHMWVLDDESRHFGTNARIKIVDFMQRPNKVGIFTHLQLILRVASSDLKSRCPNPS